MVEKESEGEEYFVTYEIKLLVAINKVLLEHSHTHSFMYGLWLLLHYSDRAE